MLLQILLLAPLLGMCLVRTIRTEDTGRLRQFGLHRTLAIFYLSLFLWIFFDQSSSHFQFRSSWNWFPKWNLVFSLGIDGISLFFILLTTFLVPMCLLASWKSVQHRVKEYLLLFLGLEWALLVVFSTLDARTFFVFFESVLIPMIFLIGVWGSRSRKIRANYYFFLYTLLGSLFMLAGLLTLLHEAHTTNRLILRHHPWTEAQQIWLWAAFFMSFAVKMPMVPLHIWLPEAHVEAPTSGSVILAGLLLKLGSYGRLRFAFPLFPEGTRFFTPLRLTLALVSVFYSSATTLRQIDFKRVIAYSSVAHMNFGLLGLRSGNLHGVTGGLRVMISHGFVSSALFLAIGVLYDRHHNRLLRYYSGLANVMPLFATAFFLLSVSNMALPGTSSFVGELLIGVGLLQKNSSAALLALLSLVVGAAYSIWLYNRACFGNTKTQHLTTFYDLSFRESTILGTFICLIIRMGFYPAPIIGTRNSSALALTLVS